MWKNILNSSDLDTIIADSMNVTQIIFKDSVICGISAFAKQRLKNGESELMKAVVNYLDILKYREVSDYIAYKLKIKHQSPQVILIKNGKVIYTASHHSIKTSEIQKFI